MKKHDSIALSSLLCLLLVSCADKETLKGKREDVIASVGSSTGIDKSPVVIDRVEFQNKEAPQPFVNASHCYAPLKLRTSIENIWTTDVDFKSSKCVRMTSSPVIAEGKIFCIDAAGIVYALNQRNGDRIWRTSTLVKGKDGQIGGAVAYDNGKLIVTSSFSECFSLNAKTGRILWRIKLPATCKGDGIAVHDGKAFIMCANSSLQVINIETGKTLWSHSGTVVDSTFLGSSSVAIDEGVVFLAYPSGEIFALLEETGTPLWDSMFSKFSLTNSAHSFVHPRACPVVKDDIVYFVASNEQTAAFNKKTGDRIWTSNFGGLQTPSVSGNSIFIFNSKSELVCLNKDTGKLRWICKLESDIDYLSDWYGQLLAGGHILMLSPTGKLHFVSPYKGRIERIVDVNQGKDSISINPVIADGVMYVLMNDGELAAYK
ncbi:outer membrane protein assembly factor BamB [Alphaproteobacteria bacterium]|nr:outer membrane protein assembly factor BamB [Alphaproteobacteria bacterium]